MSFDGSKSIRMGRVIVIIFVVTVYFISYVIYRVCGWTVGTEQLEYTPVFITFADTFNARESDLFVTEEPTLYIIRETNIQTGSSVVFYPLILIESKLTKKRIRIIYGPAPARYESTSPPEEEYGYEVPLMEVEVTDETESP